jgi:hypothetical protein
MMPTTARDSVAIQGVTPPAPARALAAWPADRPAALLRARAADGTPWSILAAPAQISPIHDAAALGRLLAPRPHAGPDAPPPGPRSPTPAPPFRTGRLLLLSYHLGGALEPAAAALAPTAPLGFVLECPGVVAFDHASGRWSRFGDAPPPPDPDAPATPFDLGPLQSGTGRAAYTASVGRALDPDRRGRCLPGQPRPPPERPVLRLAPCAHGGAARHRRPAARVLRRGAGRTESRPARSAARAPSCSCPTTPRREPCARAR